MKSTLSFFGLLIFSAITLAQTNNASYDMTCFCSGRETPHAIVSYDNNLQLIIAFKNGLTLKGLDSLNIPYTESQLKLLQVYNLIRQENDKYFSTIPVLDGQQTNQIRTQSKQEADIIVPAIENDINNFVSYLNSIHCKINAFSIMFSYILDGLVWQKFEERNLLKPYESTDNISPWTGYFWILTSKPLIKYGTNSQSDSTFTLCITDGAPYSLSKTFYERDDLKQAMLNNILLEGKVTDTAVINNFAIYNIFDGEGNVLVPIIQENNQNILYQLSNKMSDKICNAIIANIRLDEITKQFKLKDNEQALIIFYHEILWNIMAELDVKNIIDKPLILSDPSKANSGDLANLIFFIKKG